MKATLSWLRDFAPDLGDDAEEIGEVASAIGLCCEEVIRLDAGYDGVVMAEVLSLRPHPDADRIQLVDVDAGDGEALQVCCGAFNMRAGDVVPLATIGTVMRAGASAGLEISRRKLRGEWSNGMLCSAVELGLGDDHGGILIANDLSATPGMPLADALGVRGDAVFDFDLTPNRPDALSVAGLARDLAAKLGVGFSIPDPDAPESGEAAASLVDVEIVHPDLCGRFTARVLSGIDALAPTPRHIAQRLTLCGMRPISAIVDISNYVMIELGQPNHTFDLAKVEGARLRVRRSAGAETMVTLDGQTRRLEAGDGVVADGSDRPLAVAGVMGGASTEISDATSQVLLELAWWDPGSIGRTSKRLGLRSEASNRFERGVDIEIASVAARRFAALAAEVCGATLHPGEIVRHGDAPPRRSVTVRPGRVNALLDTSLSAEDLAALLEPIGFHSTTVGDHLDVSIPTWRPDATGEIDVVEEVARLYGYERLGSTTPRSPVVGGLTSRQHAVRRLRRVLLGLGLTEVMPNPFLAPDDLERCGLPADGLAIANPLVAEESVLRTSMLPGIVKVLSFNANHRSTGLSVFEIGNCARPSGPGSRPDASAPGPVPGVVEWAEVAAALGGRDAADAVRALRGLAAALGVADVVVRNAPVAGLHRARSATVWSGDVELGVVGEIDPVVLQRHHIGERVGWFGLALEPLLDAMASVPRAVEVSRYPAALVDLAFEVPDDVPADEVERTLRAADSLVASVSLFDVFRGAQVEPGTRSLAFSVGLQAFDRTLTDAEISAARSACIAAVESTHRAGLRAG